MKKQISIITSVFILTVTAENHLENVIFPSLPVTVSETNNIQCREDSEMYTENLKNFTLWAYEMWDATAKSSSGILRGTRFQVGNFEQCLTAEAPFLPKYCLAFIQAEIPQPKRHTDPMSMVHDPNEHVLERLYPYKDVSQLVRNIVQIGWCIPASCSSQDTEIFLNLYINRLNFSLLEENVTYSAKIWEKTCSTIKDDATFTGADICFCFVTLFLITVSFAATIFDFCKKPADKKTSKKSLVDRFFMPFSARDNFNELTKVDESNDALMILYGIKTVCLFFIILDHRFATFAGSAILNFDYIEKQFREPFAPFIFHGDLFVDTFFIMGGLLVTYGLLKQMDKKRLNPGFVILMRYVRLTPAYAYVVFYYATVYNYTGSGPFWKVIGGQESQDCQNNWWTNLLYINNYVNADQICMAHSWYLPCDFHYFIIAIGLCFLIKERKKAGLFSLLLLTIISILILFAITIINERPGLLRFYPDFLLAPKSHPDFVITYIKSHTRASSYFIGMFLGYIYYKQQGKEIHLNMIKNHIIAATSVVLMGASIVGGAVFYDPYHKYNAFESAVYAAFHRPAFDLGTIGIIYICSHGYANFIRKILTWSPFIPLSKLTFGAYLLHMQFQLRYTANFTNPRRFSYFDVTSLALADTVLSFLAAFALYLFIEAPFRKIFREILMQNKVSPPKENGDAVMRPESVSNRACDSRL